MMVSARLEETSSLPPPAPGQGKEGEDGHQDGSQAGLARGYHGLLEIVVVFFGLCGEVDEEDSVRDDDADEEQEAEQGREAQGRVRQEESPKAPTVVRERRGV